MSRTLPEPWEKKSLLSAVSRLELKLAQRRLKSYPYWLEQLKDLDEWFESISSPDLFSGTGVSGGEMVAVQEQILLLKEKHPGYSKLRSRVEKVGAIMGVLPPNEKEIVRLWHFERADEYDICGILDISRSTMFRYKSQAERRFAFCWGLCPLENVTSEQVKKMTLEVSG